MLHGTVVRAVRLNVIRGHDPYQSNSQMLADDVYVCVYSGPEALFGVLASVRCLKTSAQSDGGTVPQEKRI